MTPTLIPSNHISVYPKDAETKFIFEPYLSSCPFTSVLPENLFTSVALTRTPIFGVELDPNRVYSAFIKGAEIWLDSYSEIKDMIITLESPELELRHKQILEQSQTQSVYPNYVPHLALAFDVPNFSSRNRWWFNQVIEDFTTKYVGRLIRLHGENLQSSSGIVLEETLVIQNPTL